MIKTQSQQGLALILVVGVLVGLSILATVFVVMSRSSRDLSTAARDKAVADLLAQSGMDHAKAALEGTAFKKAYSEYGDPWVYRNDQGLVGQPESLALASSPSYPAGADPLVS